MKLKYVILFVDDVRKTMGFYGRAFDLETTFVAEEGDFGQMSTGDTVLAFSSRRLMESLGKNPAHPDPAAPVFEIGFETSDVEGALQKALDAGATLVQEVRHEAWGQTTSYVSDINGYLVEICSPVAPQS